LRVEAYGDVDELNSLLGVLVALLPEDTPRIVEELQQTQATLLHVGAWLATTPESPTLDLLQEIEEAHWQTLEKSIDRMEEELDTLKGFILPGGGVPASMAHVARTVCRRAERHVVRLADETGTGGEEGNLQGVIIFLNRLSDYLFVLARYCNWIEGLIDIPWKR
jgi:cob(I)alamin adenosyltransferase